MENVFRKEKAVRFYCNSQFYWPYDRIWGSTRIHSRAIIIFNLHQWSVCLQTITRFYADGTALFVSGKLLSDVQTLTNLELFNVSQWMQANSLIVSTKTVALIITPQSHLSLPGANDKSSIDFTFNNDIVQPSTSGITIDYKLSLKQHIIFLENRVARSVEIIAKVSCYIPFNTRITLYHALVHSQPLYALPIWHLLTKLISIN